jgi:hypothetical protein
MAAKWKQGYDIGNLTTMLEGARETTASGTVQYEWFKLEKAIAILQTCVEVSPEIPPRQKEDILRAAVNKSLGWRGVRSADLLNAISAEEGKFLGRPHQPYVLATSLSIRHFADLRPVGSSTARITFSPRLPAKFEQGATVADAQRSLGLSTPPEFTRVRIAVKARSEVEAYYRAMDSLDFFRAVWNLQLNRHLLAFHSGRVRPINQILLGPIHTLHGASGKLAIKNVWYEPGFFPIMPSSVQVHWPQLREYEQFVRKRLRTVEYGGAVRTSLVRYTRALDQQDFGTAFQGLWSVLEALSGTGRNSYDTTIKRTLFLYKDPTNNRLVLEHLRNIRNDMVHVGQGTHEHNVERVLRQLMNYVHDFFRFYLEIRHGIKEFEEMIKLLDSEQDLSLLQEKIEASKQQTRLLKKAFELRKP